MNRNRERSFEYICNCKSIEYFKYNATNKNMENISLERNDVPGYNSESTLSLTVYLEKELSENVLSLLMDESLNLYDRNYLFMSFLHQYMEDNNMWKIL